MVGRSAMMSSNFASSKVPRIRWTSSGAANASRLRVVIHPLAIIDPIR
jgi:hypothetical protein